MPNKAKRKKSTGHGGKREGAGRKPVLGLTCPTCMILSRQLELAAEREKALLKQLGIKDSQIGQVIENKFETVRVANQELPEPNKPVMPIEQLMDVENLEDGEFVKTVAGMTQ